MTEGWQGRHTLDVPVVVVTHWVPTDWVEAHPDAPFTFVTDGVQAAIARAQELAGDRVVTITGGTIARQCLDLGLIDGQRVMERLDTHYIQQFQRRGLVADTT